VRVPYFGFFLCALVTLLILFYSGRRWNTLDDLGYYIPESLHEGIFYKTSS
jgi:hypothetical protein